MAPINVCVLIRGELAIGRIASRRTLVCGRSVWILTMMQSCASAAKLRAAGPFSPSASGPCQLPVPPTSDRQSAVRAERQRERRIGKMLVPEVFQPAGRRMTPSTVSPVVTKRQSAMSSLRANATIIVLRVPGRLSAVRARYHCASALVLKPQKAPGELDHAAADPGIAGSGEALFPPPRTALVRRARQTGVARHRFAVTHWAREHLMDEHISRFNADADDPSHLPDHGVRPGFRLLLQSFLTSLLDLPDLADDKAQPRHVALQLGQYISRQRRALWGVQRCKTLRCLAQGGFEIAHAEPGQAALHAVDDARAFPDQALALPIWPLGVLFGNRRDARHRS